MRNPKTILLMRHAKAKTGDPGDPDHERPLNKRGKEAAHFMGGVLREHGLVPGLFIVSTARRALETSRGVVAGSGYAGEVVTTERLYLAEPPAYFELLSEVPPGTQSVLLVAHNPGIADLVELLAGQTVEMCTAGLARLEFDVEEISAIDRRARGSLVQFLRPPRD